MAAKIGRIISLTQIGDSALPLYIQTTKNKLETPVYDQKEKFSLKLNSLKYVLKSDLFESIGSAIDYCDFFMKIYFPHLYEEFNKSHFFIEIGCEGVPRPLAVRGKSCGFAVALSILSSIFQFRIRDDVAVTGQIDRNGKILFVMSMKEKLDRFLKDNSFSRFLAPYVASKSEESVKEFYQYLDEHIDFMEKNGKIMFLCSSILESLYFVTSKKSGLMPLLTDYRWDGRWGSSKDKFNSVMIDAYEGIYRSVVFSDTRRIFPEYEQNSETCGLIWDEIKNEDNRFSKKISEIMMRYQIEKDHQKSSV